MWTRNRTPPGTLPPNNEIAGCIAAVALHPSDPDIIYIGWIGGRRVEDDECDECPSSWTPLTDRCLKLSAI